MYPEIFCVKDRRKENTDIYTFDLVPQEANGALDFKPGQFSMLYNFGQGEVPISISGDPTIHEHLTFTIRDAGSVTASLIALKHGDTIGVRGPFGTAWPIEAAKGKDIIFVAGGIGLAPLRPAIYHVLANRNSYGDVHLLYGSRSPKDILYREEQGEWATLMSHFEVSITVDYAPAGYKGRVGVVTELIAETRFEAQKTAAFICGPEIMMRFAAKELEVQGLSDEQIFVSMERNMQCGCGICGRCQCGNAFVCKDGPVFDYKTAKPFFKIKGL